MAAIRQSPNFDWPRTLTRDGLHLLHCAVFIIESLNDQRRTRDPVKIFFDVPAAKIRMQPDIVPPPEGARSVTVMSRQLFREVRGLEFHLGISNRRDTEVLDENMRRQ